MRGSQNLCIRLLSYALARKSNQRINLGRPAVPSPTKSSRQQESSAANGEGKSQQSRPTNNLRRSQTNARGDKKCFQSGKFGYLMYSCPETQGQATKPALSGMGHCTRCSKVIWNQGSQVPVSRHT